MLLFLETATIFSIAIFQTPSYVLSDKISTAGRDGKFSIFNIIKFQNSPCVGGTRNGTCFTAAECEDNGGKKDGECADGFGVCCVTILANGAATALNQSYILSDSSSTGRRKRQTTTVPTGNQIFTICPCSSNVCRIRFDFTMFTLAGPVTGLGTQAATTAPVPTTALFDDSLGDCHQDTFSITSSAGAGTPVICGTMTGQHLIVDSDGSGCSTVNMDITGTFATRMWDIMITQFVCGDENGGPPGCLQYFTGTNNIVRSFNYPNQAPNTAVPLATTHLSNQHYTACFRREAGMTMQCYTTCTTVVSIAGMAQASFGLSLTNAAAMEGAVDTDCVTDYLTIPNGLDSAMARINVAGPLLGGAPGSANTRTVGHNRFCGRLLATMRLLVETPLANHVSICTTQVPFTLGVDFDEDEILNGVAGGSANLDEANDEPGGIVGFCLRAVQVI